MGEYELYHHGIKGMKWGVRRYQNKDGTLTEAGKKRQARRDAVSAKVDAWKGKRAAKKSAKAAEELRKKPLSKLTDAELEDRIKRLTKEKQAFDLQRSISNLNPNNISSGRDFVKKFATNAVGQAVVDGGKRALTDYFDKMVRKATGIDNASDSVGQLKKEVEKLGLQKQKKELSEYLDRGGPDPNSDEAIAKKAKRIINENIIEKTQKEMNDRKKKAAEESSSGSKTENNKANKSSNRSDDTVLDAEWTEVSVSDVSNHRTTKKGKSYIEQWLIDSIK